MSELPETVRLPSGATLTLKDAPFETSMRLLKAVAREFSQVTTGLKIDVNLGTDPAAISKLLAQDLPIDLLKNSLCQLIASDAIEGIITECMGRCLYNGVSATRDVFESRKARQDYILAAWEVMKLNLAPFFGGLISKSSTAAPLVGAAPK